MVKKVFWIDPAKFENPKLRFWVRLFRRPLELLFRFPAVNRIHAKAMEGDPSASFPRNVLAAMGVTWRIGRSAGADGSPIPAEGPVVVVANHPFGGIEGVVMLAMMEQWRSDSKALVNFMLSIVPEIGRASCRERV